MSGTTLTTKAVFLRKETEIEATDCVVEKVVRLSGAEFDDFSRNLLRDWDFIRDNQVHAIVDEDGRHHCLLVVGEGRRDGILVNSEGSDYARYSALLPNADSWLAAEQYPAISNLAQKLERALRRVEGLVAKADAGTRAGEALAIDLDALGAITDIDFDYNHLLLDAVTETAGGLPGVTDTEFDGNKLLLYRDEASSARLVTKEEMSAYGYLWEGMEPLDKAAALERFKDGKEVYLLYPDDTEAAADSREAIERHGGLFGYEDETAARHSDPGIRQSDIDAYGHEVAGWVTKAKQAPGRWREDTRYRQHKDGTFYYYGGKDGQYMRLANDGKLTVGRYKFAKPGIADAVLVPGVTKDMGSYERAVLLAAQLGGSRFLSDLDGMEKYAAPVPAFSIGDSVRTSPGALIEGVGKIAGYANDDFPGSKDHFIVDFGKEGTCTVHTGDIVKAAALKMRQVQGPSQGKLSVLERIREAQKNPPPHRPRDENNKGKGGPEL